MLISMITTAQYVVKDLAGGKYRCEDADDETEVNVYRLAKVSSQAGISLALAS